MDGLTDKHASLTAKLAGMGRVVVAFSGGVDSTLVLKLARDSATMTFFNETTVGQVMKSAGYATGVIGKWDSGRAKRFLPPQRGFDFYYGFANTGIDYFTHERYGVPSMFRGNERVKEQGHATDLFRREALRFIDDPAWVRRNLDEALPHFERLEQELR